MKKLYLFNPDSDLALANGNTNYMPPASARQMASDLAVLPVWYAEPGSVVLAPSACHRSFLKEMQQRIPLPATLLTEPEVAAETALSPMPWGWNPAVRKRFLRMGIAEEVLPSASQMAAFRRLSHRQRAVELLPRLQLSDSFCGESFYLTDAVQWEQFVEAHETCLLKAPLSGSGKGLNWCRGEFTSFVSGWCGRVSAMQGGVVGEPVYEKAADFAMEFQSDAGGRVVFAGYSLFATGASGAYEGNLLLSDAEIESRLSAFVPLSALRLLRQRLTEELSALLGADYAGYLGVDMMICRVDDSYKIHPCVEINLRMSMGMVARLLFDRYLHPGAQGVFRVSYASSAAGATAEEERLSAEFPLQLSGGSILSGYLPLVPVTGRSQYRAWVQVL